MKKMLMAAIACLLASATFAAQCEGKTKTGDRCKREAAEGSKYCIGHADQSKTAAAKEKKSAAAMSKSSATAKLKDDGTCWAVTEAGTRCKHKKDGESDYCKQHGVDVKAKKPGKCRALKWDGNRCTREAEDGYLYCKQHRSMTGGKKQAEKK